MKVAADAYPFRTLPAPLRAAVAVAAVAVVFLIDRVGGAAIDDGSHFLLLGMAVMATAWFAGTGPALAATVLGAIVGALQPWASDASSAGTSMHLALFVMQGVLLTVVVAELRAARRAAERQARIAHEARREGEAVNLLKDQFLATVSHELRTPLNAVLGWVHLLRTGKLDASTTARGLESIDRNIRLQAQITGDLLDVSRALNGQLQLDARSIALGDATRQAARSLQATARAKGVSVDLSLGEDPIVILGDADRIRQVVWHLLGNAIKFTPRGGHVELTTGTTGDEAWLRVRDSGSGIDPEFLPRIFDRFTQADSSPTRAAGGLGVGLALVRQIVELHGGRVEARNRTEGTGTVFTVRFPLHAGEPVTRDRDRDLRFPVAIPPLDGLRVLVLDQDQGGRDLLRTVLQQRGATVRAVASVGDALESLEGWSPDVLVSDSAPSGHESYALVGKVYSLDAHRGGRIPALALTAAARSDERLSGLLSGVQCNVPKPVEPGVLALEIARLTGRERRRARR